jgi:very-short-patch-repair endonuclease
VNLDDVFRGSVAVAAGVLTADVLRGPRYRRLFPDVYAPAELGVDLAVRSRAAHVLVEPGGVLSGHSAAELLGASSGPAHAAAEVTCRRGRYRLPGLIVHRDRLAAEETVLRDGLRTTTPVRTAFDLARWRDLPSAVAAVDALAHRYPFTLADLRAVRSRHLGARDSRALEPVLALVDRRSESPMESRIRLALVLGGLPPQVQVPVVVGGRILRVDLGYPEVRLGVEHDGAHHREAGQARRDLVREAELAAAGWKIIRFDAATVLHRPHLIVVRTRAAILARTRVIAVSAS